MKTNTMDKWRRIGTMLCVASVLGFTACDDDDDTGEIYDSERFYSDYRASNLYEESDTNQDGTWDEDEFNENAFNTWDTNRDGRIDQSEFTTASTDFRTTGSGMNFNTLDTNADNALDRGEFRPGFLSNNFYNTYDANQDGTLTEREFTDGTFNQLDTSGTGVMNEADYNRFNNRYFRF